MAGPFGISGTAALVGAMKAYEKMTGETVSQENADAATNELVVTSDLASDIGNEKAEELMALTKQRIADGDFDTVGEIQDVVKEASEELGVTLTDEQEQALVGVFDKINGLDLDVDKLKQQAEEVYGKLQQLGLDAEKASGILSKITQFFKDVADKIASFFKDLF